MTENPLARVAGRPTAAPDSEQTLARLREDLEVAHALLGLSASLADVRSVNDTLAAAVAGVRTILAADRCFAAVWQPAQRRFEVRAVTEGYPQDALTIVERLAASKEGLPLLGRAFAKRSPLLVGNCAEDPQLSAEMIHPRRLGAFIAIPLLRGGREFGALGVEYGSARRFGPRTEALADGITRQVGAALTSARRFGLLRSLRSFGLTAGSKLRLADLMEEVTSVATELLGADGAVLYVTDDREETLTAAGVGGSFRLPEGLVRLDLRREELAPLARGKTVMVTSIGSAQTEGDGPATYLAAPLLGGDRSLMGAVVAFFLAPPSLDEDEADALSVLAAQTASAMANARSFERQRRVALSLQEGLLAMERTSTEGYEVGTVYASAGGNSDVGGDFFDFFELSDGRFGLVVGDVSGKGAEAAAQAAMAKYMLRAFAARNPSPSSVLYHLNSALTRSLAEDRFITMLYGVLDPMHDSLTLAAAGHPAPLLHRAAERRIETPAPEGPVLGVFPNEQYEPETLELLAGDVVVAFTDGLLDVRNEDDFFGREGIAAALERHASLPAQALADNIFADAQGFGAVVDDTVVFSLRRAQTN
jgi:GAF domain-containing protein